MGFMLVEPLTDSEEITREIDDDNCILVAKCSTIDQFTIANEMIFTDWNCELIRTVEPDGEIFLWALPDFKDSFRMTLGAMVE